MTATVSEDGSGEVAAAVWLSETVRGALSEGGFVTDDRDELARILAEEGPDAVYAEDLPDPVDTLAGTAPEGWRVERLEEGRARGVRFTGSFDRLGEIPALVEPLDDWGDEVVARHGRDAEQVGLGPLVRGLSITRDGPVFHFKGHPTGGAYAGATGGPNRLAADSWLSVTLPGGIRGHDADDKDGSTLTWRIPPGEERVISATSDLTYHPRDVPVVPIGVGVSAAGLAGLLAWGARRARRASGPARPAVPPET